MGQDGTEQRLRQWLAPRRPDLARAKWTPMPQGRTNKVWCISTENGLLIGKLSVQTAQTPMFPNDAHSEVAALQILTDWPASPTLYNVLDTPHGPFLEMSLVPGRRWSTDIVRVAHLLRELHDHPPPDGVRRLALDDATLVDEPAGWLGCARAEDREACLSRKPRNVPSRSIGGLRFLHGDPVPGNLLETKATLMAIDWQCPALGHPVFDLATFVSPCMQVLAGNPPLCDTSVDALLEAYGDQEITDQFRQSRNALSWRMACYAAWRVGNGHWDYAEPLSAELALLDELQHRPSHG